MVFEDIKQKQQELFDKVATHLITQNAQSLMPGGSLKKVCAYRGAGGLKCAIGALIPDEAYSADFEGCSVNCTMNEETGDSPAAQLSARIRKAAGISESLINLAGCLQMTHDIELPERWPSELRNIAKSWGLNYDSVTNAYNARILKQINATVSSPSQTEPGRE